ncbi:hypothetical protein SGPA1_51038 [Streptomyces misionensis JCM 4497]
MERRAAGRPVRRPGPAGGAGAVVTRARAGHLRDHDRRQRRHPPDAVHAFGAVPVGGGTAAAHGRCGGGGRHLSRPRHHRAGAAAAALAGPAGVPAAGGGADDRRGGAGGTHRVPGRSAGARVRGEPAGAVRAGQLPPLGRGLRHGGDGRPADGLRGAGPVAGGGGAAGRDAPRGLPAGGPGRGGGGVRGGHGGHGGDADGPARSLGAAQAPAPPPRPGGRTGDPVGLTGVPESAGPCCTGRAGDTRATGPTKQALRKLRSVSHRNTGDLVHTCG